MHKIAISPVILERVIERRGRVHLFEAINPGRTALIVVDLQNGFMVPGQPAEIANAREIVPNVNRLASALREAGGTVVFIQNTITEATRSEWTTWFENFLSGSIKDRMIAAFQRGSYGHRIYAELDVKPEDWCVEKQRFGAFVEGSSRLDAMLKAQDIDTLIITGTATNVCCESTARDAMMMNYKVIFVSDANACRTDEEHNGTLGNILALFGDVQSTDDVVTMIVGQSALPVAAE